jgi:hypothetical protein
MQCSSATHQCRESLAADRDTGVVERWIVGIGVVMVVVVGVGGRV